MPDGLKIEREPAFIYSEVVNKDQIILKKFRQNKSWGLYTSIDLKGCNLEYIRSAEKIKEFTKKLCQLIDVKRYGECMVVDFGEDPRVRGYSLVQLIETSIISGHFGNETNGRFLYLDIFSCKEYPPFKAALFTKEFFKGKKMKIKINFRG